MYYIYYYHRKHNIKKVKMKITTLTVSITSGIGKAVPVPSDLTVYLI